MIRVRQKLEHPDIIMSRKQGLGRGVAFCARHRALFGILLMAVVLASAVVFPIPNTLSHNQDFDLYNAAAQHIRQGDVLMKDLGRMAPGWPFYLAFIYSLLGDGPTVLAYSQILLFLILIVVTYVLARSVLGNQNAILATFLTALWPSLLFTLPHGSSMLLYSVIFITFCSLAFEAFREGSLIQILLAGLLLGFGMLTDVVALFLPVVFILWAAWYRYFHPTKYSWKRFFVMVAFFVSAVLLIICPWMYRNENVIAPDSEPPPLIAKNEQRYLAPENSYKALNPFLRLRDPLLINNLGRMFAFPAGIHRLDPGTTLSYKDAGLQILSGEAGLDDFSSREKTIFVLKLLATLLHLAVLGGALWTIILLRTKGFGALVAGLTIYIILAVVGTIALSNGYYRAISPPNGFLIPFAPLFLILAVGAFRRYLPKRFPLKMQFKKTDNQDVI